jgi:hypothetical protein
MGRRVVGVREYIKTVGEKEESLRFRSIKQELLLTA